MEAVLIPEFGVIHLKGALTETEQKQLWSKCKPNVRDPAGATASFTGFHVSSGTSGNRDEALSKYGELLFQRSAEK